ncbi:uncharacterized protein LOC127875031 [Dreissena polymorpha]|uniref:B box-type domain-containing protein n=1 Tax=Dreissena polymorpha TaxID=45954 RepID=A0A9D4MQ42_DREPO|nr:uncharacterized protein LOC127875031 [Dreissena polymorpha]XP_052275792.1 uncharacterized protein LOC127875031 [Dreissena polymorpha]KAH3879267.1 hypothetical protein DPMN_003170 [Dreissena polymorpha]
MATSGISKNSDVVMYYCCTICKTERSVEIHADFYCEKCLKYFCRTCINSHRQHGRWFYKKSPYGKDKIRKWPLSKKMETSLLICIIHKREKLTMFCPDHNHLCCSKCVELNHRRCLQVTPLPQAASGKSTNFKNLSVSTENTLSKMKQCQTYQENIMMSLKVSYKEHERLIVDGLRVNIISYLRECETSTVNTTHEHMQYPISEMREGIKNLLADFEKSTIKEKKEELNLKQAPLKVVRNSCIRLHYELFHLHVAIPKVLGKPELSFIASKKCLENIQQSDIFLKENFPNHVFTVNGKSVHNVKMPSDSYICSITAVCALPNGQVLVADRFNKKVKLLSQQYRVVSHLDVRDEPPDMCLITPTEVAVAVHDEVQFITVSQSQLAKSRKLKLQHECTSIVQNQGNLYICSGTALYKFTLSGKLVSWLYGDTSADLTVYKCAVSPTGDRLYITSWDQHKLLTLARDGTLLATYSDLALGWPTGLHVTPAGQVLVCGYLSDTVLQVGWEGESKLATLATQKDGMRYPVSVCFSSSSSSIIVGLMGSDHIRVFRVE